MIYGRFKNSLNEEIEVQILKSGTSTHKIGADEYDNDPDLYFSDDPVTINVEDGDIDECIVKSTATVRLYTRINLFPDIYSEDPYGVKLTITNITRSTNLFEGWAIPQSLNQDFSEEWNLLEINSIDYLGTLEYKPFLNKNWVTAVSNSSIKSFKDIIIHDILGSSYIQHIYVCSSNANVRNMYNVLLFKCNESVFCGDSEDDQKYSDEALNEILKYLGLKIYCRGPIVFIYDPLELSTLAQVYAIDAANGTLQPSYMNRLCTDCLVNDIDGYIDRQYDITIDRPITKIKVNVDRKVVDTVVPNLFEDMIDSNYVDEMKFMTEFCVPNVFSPDSFLLLLNNRNEPFPLNDGRINDEAWMRNWYIQILNNKGWTIYDKNGNDVQNLFYSENIPSQQWWLERGKTGQYYGVPVLLDVIAEDQNKKSNGTKQLGWTTNRVLVIPVDGNGKDTVQDRFPRYDDQEDDLSPDSTVGCLMKYESQTEVDYSPADDESVNYLIFNGKMGYAPLLTTSYKTYNANGKYSNDTTFYDIINAGTYTTYVKDHGQWTWNISSNLQVKQVTYSELRGGFRPNRGWNYYTSLFFDGNNESQQKLYIEPMIEDAESVDKLYQYNYSQDASNPSNIDTIAKFSTLYCSLQIGDKYLNETFVQDDRGIYQSVFEWSYDSSSKFTLGFDPALGDWIIGTYFDMSNNVTRDMKLESKGMAIPIRKDDNLHGTLTFKIISLVDPLWFTQTKKTKRFLGIKTGTSTQIDYHYILSHVSSLCIKDFKITLEASKQNNLFDVVDLCYMSNNGQAYIKNEKEVDFNLCTGLTSEEAYRLKVENEVYSNTVHNSDDSIATSIYGYKKAEEAFIEKWYDFLSVPRKLYKITIPDLSTNVPRNYGNILLSPYFYQYTTERNGDYDLVIQGENLLRYLKSIEYDLKRNYITFEGYDNNTALL